MHKLYNIIKEIDEGIETIKPFLSGETRQIAECQIIGLEEAKKIVTKYVGQPEATQEGNVKRIKLFPAPHIELRIYVSEQMQKDWIECETLAEETSSGGECGNCSWKEVKFGDKYICEMMEKGMLDHENARLPRGEK